MKLIHYSIALFTSLLLASACGAEVTVATGSTGDNGRGASSGGVDQRCYEACLRAGGTQEECTDACWDPGAAGSSSSGSKTTSGGSSGSGSGSTTDPADPTDEELSERYCYMCMKENAGSCAEEHAACQADLACKVLSSCPFNCTGDTDCIEQCKDIVPKGVEKLSALVQCMICDNGPCQIDCIGSSMLTYCE